MGSAPSKRVRKPLSLEEPKKNETNVFHASVPQQSDAITEDNNNQENSATSQSNNNDDKDDEEKYIENEINKEDKLSQEEILQKIYDDLKVFKVLEEPWEKQGRNILLRLLKRYYKSRTKPLLIKVADLLIENGFLDVYVRIWKFCHSTDVEEFIYLHSKAYYNMKIVYWNYSDKCPNLAKATFEHKEVIRCCMKEFSLPDLDVPSLKNHRKRYTIKASLGIMLNVVRHYNSNYQLIREDNGVEKLAAYYASTYLIVKAKVMILLAYCINEEENDKIVTGTGVIGFIMKLLGNALYSPNHVAKTYAFSAAEIVMGLDKLAFNDDNKKSIVEAGILVHLKQMLSENDTYDEEQDAAAHCLWTLSFHSDNKEKIKQESGLLDAVHSIHDKSSTDATTLRSCDGILFNVEGIVSEESSSSKKKDTSKHIMISYQWDVQNVMLEVRDQLKEHGFEVWVDVDRIKGSILTAMADGVENSAVVIVAMTEQYKNSNSCRQEAEYAYTLSKPIVPLLLQPNYRPDGWLGILLGMQLFVDFSNQISPLNENVVTKLLEIIESKIRSQVQNREIEETLTVTDAPVHKPAPHVVPSILPPPSAESCIKWSSKKVADWFSDLGFEDAKKTFAKFDGKALYQLSKLLHRSPDTYYTSLRNDFKLEWVKIFHLTDALEKLT